MLDQRPLLAAMVAMTVTAGVWLALASHASAEHAPDGSGACATHDLTCYPECAHEWGGRDSNSLGGIEEIERDFCPVGPEYTDPHQVAQSGAVEVVNPDDGTRLDVDAICENAGEECAPGEMTFADLDADDVNALGLYGGLAAGVLVGGVVFRRNQADG